MTPQSFRLSGPESLNDSASPSPARANNRLSRYLQVIQLHLFIYVGYYNFILNVPIFLIISIIRIKYLLFVGVNSFVTIENKMYFSFKSNGSGNTTGNGTARVSPAGDNVVRPRIVTIIRNGVKPRKVNFLYFISSQILWAHFDVSKKTSSKTVHQAL